MILHPVGSVGHIMHSDASGTRKVDVLVFMLGWDQYGFHKKRTWTPYAELVFLHPVGYTVHVVHTDASRVGNVNALFFTLMCARCGFRKNAPRHFTLNLFFTSGGICGSRSAFLCVRGAKH
jgi:hypothetical protein